MAAVIKATLAAAGEGVAMFSKSYCPYCKKAKAALLSIGRVKSLDCPSPTHNINVPTPQPASLAPNAIATPRTLPHP